VIKEQQVLCEGAELMQISLSSKQISQLLRYLSLILKWNRTYNLSAIRDPIESVKKHLLDSLSIIPYLKPGRLLDVGSGAGLPGIVISIMLPEIEVSVLDSVGKKCRFMQVVKTELELEGLKIINSRVESLEKNKYYNQITSRAFAGVNKTIQLTEHLLADNGIYLLMKGDYIKEKNIEKLNVIIHPLSVPFIAEKRSVLEIKL
jgi:16S rRNA (guanine527-N7)-methyltransferase